MKVKQKICGIFMVILAAVLMLTSIVSADSVGQPIGVNIVKVIVNGAEVGVVGEVNPVVLEAWKLENPAAAFEVNFKKILDCKLK